MNERPKREPPNGAVSEYKAILKAVLENRPSGMRQKLAEAIGKNRSFVSQISSPSYQVPIPARHVGLILDICHFSPRQRAAFLKAYAEAHPGRLNTGASARHERKLTVTLPDLGSVRRNQELEALILDVVHRLAALAGDEPQRRTGGNRDEKTDQRR